MYKARPPAQKEQRERNSILKKVITHTINTPAQLEKAFQQYLEQCKNHTVEVLDKSGASQHVPQPKIPTLKGFWCVYMGKPWAQWKNLLSQDKYRETCSAVADTLEGIVLDALINGEGNSTGLIFDLKANYGYTDKQLASENLQIRRIEISVKRGNDKS